MKRVEMDAAAYALRVPAVAAQDRLEEHVEADPLFASAGEAAPHDEPDPEPAERIDLEAVRAEAEALVAQGRADAEALVARARADADAAILDARARVAAIEAEAHDRGFESGDRAGRAAADAEMEDMLETMRGLIDVARAERLKMIESAEPELVRLATEIAERVVHAHLAVDGDGILAIARNALQRLIGRENVTVRVNPADVERLRTHREALLGSHDVESMRIVEDQRVDRGGIIIETESGTVDAKISSQLREARRALHVEDLAAPAAS